MSELRQLVVGAAIVRDGRVLAARRLAPPASAGHWEFPGGKVEAGESPNDALVREIREELNCEIEIVGWLGARVPVSATQVLTVAHVVLSQGEPRVGSDHDEVRWLGPTELRGVPWLAADLVFLPELEVILSQPAAGALTVRAVVFEEADAQSIMAQLQTNGYSARIERERLAGEDDDEAHPWAIVTDAPALMVEILIDRVDGWIDEPDTRVSTYPPLSLPAAPKRLHGEP